MLDFFPLQQPILPIVGNGTWLHPHQVKSYLICMLFSHCLVYYLPAFPSLLKTARTFSPAIFKQRLIYLKKATLLHKETFIMENVHKFMIMRVPAPFFRLTVFKKCSLPLCLGSQLCWPRQTPCSWMISSLFPITLPLATDILHSHASLGSHSDRFLFLFK